jgi:hypothetical protein
MDFTPSPRLTGDKVENGMISEGLAREAIGNLGTAAAMLIEDVHLDLLTSPADIDAAWKMAVILQSIGTELDALGAAAAVLAKQSTGK